MDPSGAILPIEAASLDRIDPNGDYTQGNSQIISDAANSIRKAPKKDLAFKHYIDNMISDPEIAFVLVYITFDNYDQCSDDPVM